MTPRTYPREASSMDETRVEWLINHLSAELKSNKEIQRVPHQRKPKKTIGQGHLVGETLLVSPKMTLPDFYCTRNLVIPGPFELGKVRQLRKTRGKRPQKIGTREHPSLDMDLKQETPSKKRPRSGGLETNLHLAVSLKKTPFKPPRAWPDLSKLRPPAPWTAGARCGRGPSSRLRFQLGNPHGIFVQRVPKAKGCFIGHKLFMYKGNRLFIRAAKPIRSKKKYIAMRVALPGDSSIGYT